MKTQVLHAHPLNDQEMDAIKAFCQALNIKFEVSKGDTYDPEFVEKTLESRQQVQEGKVTRVKKEKLKEFLGL